MISKARNSTFELIFTHNKNSTTFTFLESTIKNVLSEDYPNCQKTIYSKDLNQWCFQTIVLEIMDIVQDNWSVTVGKSNKCYSATEKPNYTYIESYFFLVAIFMLN